MTDFGRRAGDMAKDTYDADKDGTVDNAEKLQGSTKAQVRDHTPKAHTHTQAQISDLSHDAQKIKGVVVDDAAKADTKVLAYDSASSTLKYVEAAAA